MSSSLSNAGQSMPAFFALQIGKDRYVVKDDSSDDFRVAAESGGAVLFQMPSVSETSDELVLLQILGGRTQVPADPSLGVVLQDSSAAQAPFLKVPVGDGFALGTPDREHWLSASDEGKLVFAKLVSPGESETFTTKTPPRHHGHSCCGPSPSGPSKALWNDVGHRLIVMKGIECLRKPSQPTAESRMFIELWDSNPAVQGELFSGLYDADYDDALRDKVKGITYYTSHFYDPDTGKNYWGDDSPTALERGRDFFNASLKVLGLSVGGATTQIDIGRRSWSTDRLRTSVYPLSSLQLLEVSFKMLGIALHYLTDLTQPMHAANIANVYGGGQTARLDDWRHSHWEDYSERRAKSGYLLKAYPQLTVEQTNIGGITSVDEIYKGVAKASKKVWKEDVQAIFDSKRFDEAWGDEAKRALLHSMHPAPVAVARFLLFWTKSYMNNLFKRTGEIIASPSGGILPDIVG